MINLSNVVCHPLSNDAQLNKTQQMKYQTLHIPYVGLGVKLPKPKKKIQSVAFTHYKHCTTIDISSNHGESMSKVRTREMLVGWSPSACQSSRRARLLPSSSLEPPYTAARAHSSTIACWFVPHMSVNPSEQRIRYLRGAWGDGSRG